MPLGIIPIDILIKKKAIEACDRLIENGLWSKNDIIGGKDNKRIHTSIQKELVEVTQEENKSGNKL